MTYLPILYPYYHVNWLQNFNLGKGPKKKNGHFMVFDHNWGGGGGGVSPNHTLIAKFHCFLKHYIHLQLYSICSCT